MSPIEIKKIRKSRNIQLVEVAAMTGLPSSLIGQIENEEVVALDSDLERIYEALKEIIASLDGE